MFARLAEIDDADGRGERVRESAYRGCQALAEFAVTELAAPPDEGATLGLNAVQRHLADCFHLALDGLAYQFVLYPGLLSHEDVATALEGLVDLLDQNVRRAADSGQR